MQSLSGSYGATYICHNRAYRSEQSIFRARRKHIWTEVRVGRIDISPAHIGRQSGCAGAAIMAVRPLSDRRQAIDRAVILKTVVDTEVHLHRAHHASCRRRSVYARRLECYP